MTNKRIATAVIFLSLSAAPGLSQSTDCDPNYQDCSGYQSQQNGGQGNSEAPPAVDFSAWDQAASEAASLCDEDGNCRLVTPAARR